MLIKPKLETDLKLAIKKASFPAAKEALSAMFENNNNDPSESFKLVSPDVEKKMNEFATKFSNKLSNELSKSLATIIDEYIKSASVFITGVPVPSTTVLASPMGPVTGTITIPANFIKIT